jgi:hypothetical protein
MTEGGMSVNAFVNSEEQVGFFFHSVISTEVHSTQWRDLRVKISCPFFLLRGFFLSLCCLLFSIRDLSASVEMTEGGRAFAVVIPAALAAFAQKIMSKLVCTIASCDTRCARGVCAVRPAKNLLREFLLFASILLVCTWNYQTVYLWLF